MLAFTETWFGLPLWVWLGAFVVIVLLTILLARKMEFEGVNLTATPPFVAFRFKRKRAREETRQVSPDLTGLGAPVNVNTAGGDAQIAQGDQKKFLELFNTEIKQKVFDNPWIVSKDWWRAVEQIGAIPQ